MVLDQTDNLTDRPKGNDMDSVRQFGIVSGTGRVGFVAWIFTDNGWTVCNEYPRDAGRRLSYNDARSMADRMERDLTTIAANLIQLLKGTS